MTARTRQFGQRRAVGPRGEDHDLVFAPGRGRAVDGNNVQERSFRRLLQRAALPPMRFHALRDAAASLLLAHGVNVKVISEMLGHGDIGVTLRVYAHLMPNAVTQPRRRWTSYSGQDDDGEHSDHGGSRRRRRVDWARFYRQACLGSRRAREAP